MPFRRLKIITETNNQQTYHLTKLNRSNRHTGTHMYAHMYTHRCTHTHTHTPTHTLLSIYIQTFIQHMYHLTKLNRSNRHTGTHMYAHMYTHRCTHTHTPTHTPPSIYTLSSMSEENLLTILPIGVVSKNDMEHLRILANTSSCMLLAAVSESCTHKNCYSVQQ